MKIGTCKYPDSLLYDVDAGTWAKKESTAFRIGIAPHLGWISGGFTAVSFKEAGTAVGAGKSLGSVEGPKHFDVVRAPFDCVVKETNSKLQAEPRLANKDPFGEGWFALIERTGEVSRLATLADVEGRISAALKILGIRCYREFPDTEMYEIGVECSAVIVNLNDLMARSRTGTVVHLVSDDPTAEIEIARWEDQTGNKVVEASREAMLHHFILKKN